MALSMALSIVERSLQTYDSMPYDRKSVSQDRLDLSNRCRTSLFPWRGQFSPELVELLLDHFSHVEDTVLDPFAGSGTVLFESAHKGLTCYAAEINPSAIEMASTAHFVNVRPEDRIPCINKARSLAEARLLLTSRNLFSYKLPLDSSDANQPIEIMMSDVVRDSGNDWMARNILVNGIIRYMACRKSNTAVDFLDAIDNHGKIVSELPYNEAPIRIFHTDARAIPLDDDSVDLIITSPPYINVFNYHQNNRPAMELMGWDLLEIARSEFGSNRKNRQNRFLTVIQYSLDMLASLHEMRRVLTPNGRAIIIVGRESNVRGVSFKNGRIVAALAVGGAGFALERMQERAFKNKFGTVIYEDILHLIPSEDEPIQGDSFARSLSQVILDESLDWAENDVKQQIMSARNQASKVKQSPVLELASSVPETIYSALGNSEI